MATLPPLRLTGAQVLHQGALRAQPLCFAQGRILPDMPLDEVDLSGHLILPGIIDLHGDAFERHIAPRPTAPFPITKGLHSTDREAAAHGVTTAYLAQSWSWEGGLRGPEFATLVMEGLENYRPRALIDLRLQLRLETHLHDTNDQLLDAITRFGIDYVVFNNHLPEALQMASRAPHKLAAWAEREGRSVEAFMEKLRAGTEREREVPRTLCTLAQAFDRLGVTYGSHDDADGETREWFRMIGAHISEFPTSHQAAAAAKAMQDHVIMGAPNIVRGGSQSGNISAMQLVLRGHCDVLVSDYHYPCLADAAWEMVDFGARSFPDAWAMISTTPAHLLGMSDRGDLGEGKRADFIVVNQHSRCIEATVSNGRLAYLAGEVGARLARAVKSGRLAAE